MPATSSGAIGLPLSIELNPVGGGMFRVKVET